MNRNDLREKKEEESLIKDKVKDVIAKKFKGLPIKTKIILIVIGIGIVFFILIFIILISTLSSLLLFNFSGSSSGPISGFNYISTNSEDNYWWPIGSSEVSEYDGMEFANGNPSTTYITSYFGWRDLDDNPETGEDGKEDYHSGIDISWAGTHYIIAVANGTVVSANDGCETVGNLENSCGGGFGNYVKIEHSNGTTTIYAHMAKDSVTVGYGDTVNQGQILGIMGSSGRSTGQHLHFEMKNESGASINPLDYISGENPRPVTIDSGLGDNALLAMLQSWEGTGPTEGDSYVVYDDSTGVLTVGHGITLENHSSRFSARGVDVSTLTEGSTVEKIIVDDIELEIVNEMRNSVISTLNNNNIDLEDYQIDALTIRMYNVGNIVGFSEAYKQYGNTEELYDNYMNVPITAGGKEMTGLAKRRQAEWDLFYTGEYTLNY